MEGIFCIWTFYEIHGIMSIVPEDTQEERMELRTDYQLVRRTTMEAFALFERMLADSRITETLKERTGGYATLAGRESGKALLTILLGGVSVANAPKYHDYSLEKAERLSAHKTHVLSRESRDPQAGKWGGAAKGKTIIASFSGFPELIDEAFCLVWLVKIGELGLLEAREIAEKAENICYPLLEEISGLV